MKLLRVTLASAVIALNAAAGIAAKPDVLFLIVDDLRPLLGCYGDQRVRTPNIDRLAARGVLFKRAYCQYAKCGTSRLSLLTGLRPDSIGVFSNNVRDVIRFRRGNPNVWSLPRWLKDSGYETRSFGKIYHDGWDNSGDWTSPAKPGREKEMLEIVPDDSPFAPTIIADRFDCPVLQSPDVADSHLFAGRMTDEVVELLKQPRTDTPRFTAVGFRRPHLPFVAPYRYFEMYRPDRSWLAEHTTPGPASPLLNWFNSDGYVGAAKRIGLAMPANPTRAEAVDWNGYELRSYRGVPNHGPIREEIQLQLWQAYAACVSYVDTQIGRILDALDESPAGANTLVVLCSDHGWHLGEHSAWGKMTNYEIATRVPFIIAGPRIKSRRTGVIAELVDLFPTICDLAEIAPPKHLEGESLAPILHAPADNDVVVKGLFAFSQYARFGQRYMGHAIRTDRFRCVIWRESKTGQVVARELYDHRIDPGERHNVAAEPDMVRETDRLEAVLRRQTFTDSGR